VVVDERICRFGGDPPSAKLDAISLDTTDMGGFQSAGAV
jgi:hypothetical protein